MKKILSLILAMLLVLSIVPVVIAEENATDTEVNETVDVDVNETEDENEIEVEDEEEIEVEDEEEEEIEIEVPDNETAGTTPDQPLLWGLERAMERIDLALTFNRAAKAKKGLRHARERLAEVQAMIAAKRLAQAEKALRAREEIMEGVEEDIEELEEDPETEIEDVLELENEAEEQENKINLLKVKYQFKGNLTEEQQAQIQALMESCQNMTNSVKARLEVKKNKTKLKIKAVMEKTDEEIEELIGDAEEALGITAARANRVQALTRVIEKLEEKSGTVRGINVSGVVQKLERVRARLENKTQEQEKLKQKIKIKVQRRNESEEEGEESEDEGNADSGTGNERGNKG